MSHPIVPYYITPADLITMEATIPNSTLKVYKAEEHVLLDHHEGPISPAFSFSQWSTKYLL